MAHGSARHKVCDLRQRQDRWSSAESGVLYTATKRASPASLNSLSAFNLLASCLEHVSTMKGGSPPPRARAWEDARPLPVLRGGDGPGDLNLFESLGSGLASIVSDVESTLIGGVSLSATQLLPISEEGSRMCQASSASRNSARTDRPALLAHVHGRQPQGMTQLAPHSGMPFTTAGGQNSPHRGQGSSSTLSARSLANTAVARFGGAAESYQLRGERGANDNISLSNNTQLLLEHPRQPQEQRRQMLDAALSYH